MKYTPHDTITFAIRDRFQHLWSEADDIASAVLEALQLAEETRPRGLHRGTDPALKWEQSRHVTPWLPEQQSG